MAALKPRPSYPDLCQLEVWNMWYDEDSGVLDLTILRNGLEQQQFASIANWPSFLGGHSPFRERASFLIS
jgi:hypothetical protein